jgi:ParB/RepB/Spo0J family partition protein
MRAAAAAAAAVEEHPAATEGTTPSAVFMQVDVAKLDESPTNPRRTFDQGQLAELADSVQTHGVLMPILVRSKRGMRFEIIAGARRARAARMAGLEQIPARIVEMDDTQVLEVQLIENLQRSDVHPLDEAEGYRQLMVAGYDVARIAARVGRSVKYIYDRLKLQNLTKDAQDLFSAGLITAGHAVLLARLTPADQERALDSHEVVLHESSRLDYGDGGTVHIAGETVVEYFKGRKMCTVRELQSWIDTHVRFDTTSPDPMLFPEAAMMLETAAVEQEKVVKITRERNVAYDAKADGERTLGPEHWKRDDGAMPCASSVIGVVVVGPGRGESFRVCTAKKRCTVHWAEEQKEAKRLEQQSTKTGATGEERQAARQSSWQEQERRRKEQTALWRARLPKVLAAAAAAIEAAPAMKGKDLVLGELRMENDWGPESKRIIKDALAVLPPGKTPESLLRHMVFMLVVDSALDEYNGYQSLPVQLKKIGLDPKPILKAADESASAPGGKKKLAAHELAKAKAKATKKAGRAR